MSNKHSKKVKDNRGQNSKVVVVLGMGRGGTSVVAGILHILGVHMGDNLKPASISNPKGYFEDQDFIKLNKDIFNSVKRGSNYWNPPDYEKILARRGRFDSHIKSLVSKKGKGKQIWGWKMPWTNLTIELFLPFLTNPYFVVVFRNPIDVANSFVKNDKADDFFYALNLANYYNSRILDFLKRHTDLPRVFVSFECIVKDPIGEAKVISDFLGLKLTRDRIKRIRSFVIPRNRIGRKKAGQWLKSIFSMVNSLEIFARVKRK